MENKTTTPQMADYLRILFRGRWIIFMSFLTVVATSAYLTYKMEPEYQASATILIGSQDIVESKLFNAPYSQSPITQRTHVANQSQILKSRTLAEEVLQQYEESPYRNELDVMRTTADGIKPTLNDCVDRLRENTTISNVKNTDILSLTFRAFSGFEAAFWANALAEQYYESSLQASRGEVSEIRRFLEKQLDITRIKLAESEEALRNYKEAQRVVALEPETMKLVEQAATFESHYNQAETNLNSNLRRLDYLKKQLSQTKLTLVDDVTQITSPLIEQLQSDIAQRQSKVASLLATPGPGTDVTVAAIEREIKQIKERLVSETRKIASSGITSIDPISTSQDIFNNILTTEIEVRSLTARAEALRDIVDDFNAKLESLPEKSLILARLERDTQLHEKLYLMLNEKYEETRIAEVGKMPSVRIIDRATPPQLPFRPDKQMNIIIGIFLGLGLGLVITFALEFMDDSIKTPEDLERLSLPLLGTIPAVKIAEVARRLKREGKGYSVADLDLQESKLVTRFSPTSHVSESYRSLRTNLQVLSPDQPHKVLLVTSAVTREGKSTILANLAIATAQAGSRVLLVDSDLRRPTLHDFFHLADSKGLSEVLHGSLSLDKAVHKTDVENLHILTAGESLDRPSEMLATNGIAHFIDEARSKYDFVLMDSPPLLAVNDAVVLGTRVDASFLVVASGFVGSREVNHAVSLMRNVKAPFLGIVLNGLDIKKVYGSYYYHFHYYQYYQYYDNPDRKKLERAKDNGKHAVT